MQRVRAEDVEEIVCGPDLDDYLEVIQRYTDAGFDHLWVHQIGAEQEEFLDVCERELLPAVQSNGSSRRKKRR